MEKTTLKDVQALPLADLVYKINQSMDKMETMELIKAAPHFTEDVVLNDSGVVITAKELDLLYDVMKTIDVGRQRAMDKKELEMLDYALGQLGDGYIDLSGNTGCRYDEETVNLVQKVLLEYKEKITRRSGL